MSLRVRIFWSLVIPLAALALQWALWDLLKPYVWFLFYPAVFFASLLTGLAGGIAATFLSALIVWYFFIPPQLSFAITGTSNLLAILIFSVTGTAFSVVARRLRQWNRKLE